MSNPYRSVQYVAPEVYRPRRPLWLAMAVSTALVVVTIGSMVAGCVALIGAL